MNKSAKARSMEHSYSCDQHLWAHGQTLRPMFLSPHSRSRSPSLERRHKQRIILGNQCRSEEEVSLPQKRRLVLKSPQRSWPSSSKRFVLLLTAFRIYTALWNNFVSKWSQSVMRKDGKFISEVRYKWSSVDAIFMSPVSTCYRENETLS